jgi:hypothetical protein|tara:strand:- start:1596 stop:1970 length:375 start_codon:yes stop_codon:yes gene_type:complete
MSKHLYEATILQLKGRALEAYAALELLFSDPATIPDHTDWGEEIKKHARILAENENTMVTLQQYFGPRFAAPQPVAPTPVSPPAEEPPVAHEDLMERSPTYRRSMDSAKLKESIKKKQQQQEEE